MKVFEINRSGQSFLLTTDQLRARYREDPRKTVLIEDYRPLRYDFDRFTHNSGDLA